MQVAAHRPQEILGLLKLAQFGFGQQPLVDQFGDGLHTVDIFADPEQRVEVAKAALAFFQVRLDDIATVAHALVARIALGKFFGDERPCRARDHFGLKPCRSFIIQRLIAPDIARFEKRRADRQIALCHADHLVERTRRMADFQPQVPQRVEHRFNDLLGPRGLFVGRQERNIDVRKRRHFAAPVTADSEQRQPFGRRGIAETVEPLRGEIIGKPQNLVGQERLSRGRIIAALGMLRQATGNFRTPSLKRWFQDRDDLRAQTLAFKRSQHIGQRPPVDDGTAICDGFKARGHAMLCKAVHASRHPIPPKPSADTGRPMPRAG